MPESRPSSARVLFAESRPAQRGEWAVHHVLAWKMGHSPHIPVSGRGGSAGIPAAFALVRTAYPPWCRPHIPRHRATRPRGNLKTVALQPLAKLGRRSRHDRAKFESPGTHDAPAPSRPGATPAGPGPSPLDVLFTALFARNNTLNRCGLPGCRVCRTYGRGSGVVAVRLRPEPAKPWPSTPVIQISRICRFCGTGNSAEDDHSR